MKLSICIPTHERHALLEQRCLPSLLGQTRLPDEIVVADSSTSAVVSEFYQEWAKRFKPVRFIYVRTEARSVTTNRWAAFTHSSGDVILFADDDIQFTKGATAELLSTFETYPDVVGVGMKCYYEGPPPERPLRRRFRNWWLGDAPSDPNSISAGGRSTFGEDRVDPKPIPVHWLPGGTMCFRREALAAVGRLPGIDDLFGLRIGVSEDTVLSRQVGLTGTLMLLTEPFAWHPERRIATSTALSADGWRRGLRDTIGQAHALRWLARDQSAVLHDWLLMVALNSGRAAKGLLAKPLAAAGWLRLLGLLYGGFATCLIWRRIPTSPREPMAVNRKWLFL